MKQSLRTSGEFQTVYRRGKRFEGLSITAFVLRNSLSYHRFGITVSRKALGKAVRRNRAKRLLRETFRLTELSLQGLTEKYDWVLNAKSSFLSSNSNLARAEFEKLVLDVANKEVAFESKTS